MPACKQAPLSPEPVITFSACQTVSRCQLPAMTPTTNGELSDALAQTRAAWAQCAAVVDLVADCQARLESPASAPQAANHP
ncbi:MAG: Rz1-like lysis system protein LysC [Burkholderia gladioli]